MQFTLERGSLVFKQEYASESALLFVKQGASSLGVLQQYLKQGVRSSYYQIVDDIFRIFNSVTKLCSCIGYRNSSVMPEPPYRHNAF